MRGEQASDLGPKLLAAGSSPRARGAGHRPDHLGLAGGIIPACAGSRPARPWRAPGPRDHPRVRGEQMVPVDATISRSGSSPRARGAGAPATTACTRSMDHPRVRGEQVDVQGPVKVQQGSSPRARGAAGVRGPTQRNPRIIPACAGSRWTVPTSPAASPGSSPRARGAGPPARPAGSGTGIIPACAGSSATPAGGGCGGGDHPRVRGEQVGCTDVLVTHAGSSPRARGADARPQL